MTPYLTILGLVLVVLITIIFIGYSIVTNRIIRSQEKEIAQLQTQLKRQSQRETLHIVQDGRHPKFGDF